MSGIPQTLPRIPDVQQVGRADRRTFAAFVKANTRACGYWCLGFTPPAAGRPPDRSLGIAEIRVPVLVVHGERDRMVPPAHGRWLAANCPASETHIVPEAGHITALDSASDALAWIAAHSAA